MLRRRLHLVRFHLVDFTEIDKNVGLQVNLEQLTWGVFKLLILEVLYERRNN